MQKSKVRLAAIALGVIAMIATMVWWLYPSDEIVPEIPEEKKIIPFLTVESAWVDSLLAQLTFEEKIGQLILVETDISVLGADDSLMQWINQYHVGGVTFKNSTINHQVEVANACIDTSRVPLFMAGNFSEGALKDALPLARPISMAAISDDSLLTICDSLRIDEMKALGIQLNFAPGLDVGVIDTVTGYDPFAEDSARTTQRAVEYFKAMEQRRILACASHFSDYYDFTYDTLNLRDSILSRYRKLTYQQLPAILIDKNIRCDNPELEKQQNHLKQYLNEHLEFEGLVVTEILESHAPEKRVEQTLFTGADIIVVKDSVSETIAAIRALIEDGALSEEALNHRVERVLKAKAWAGMEKIAPITASESSINDGSQRELLARLLFEGSITMVKNADDILPFKRLQDREFYLIRVGKRLPTFFANLQRYKEVKTHGMNASSKGLGAIDKRYKRYNPLMIALNDVALDSLKDEAFIKSLKDLDELTNLVVVNFGHPNNLQHLHFLESLVQVYENHKHVQALTAQLLFGGIAAKGKLPVSVAPHFAYQTGITDGKPTRFKYTIPEEVGISSDSLLKIDWIARSAINGRATPGCQVFIAKEGKVIYHKAFGFHTYDQQQLVQTTDLYDLASVTKVASTTIMAMRLYEQGKYQLNDSLKYYLPDTLFTRLGDITFRELLIHKTGLPAGFPILPFIQYTDSITGTFDKYFCDIPDTFYNTLVADSFFIEQPFIDTLWMTVHSRWPGEKKYKYSDLNFCLLSNTLSTIAALRIDSFVQDNFYCPLGLENICYLPLDTIEKKRIVPTEDDRYWRHQLLQGHVHDPTAALFGGVAGNAGLFATAHDVAVLFQMLLNKGEYGGTRYFNAKTVELFTTKQSDSHRGLGFNKPTEDKKGIYAPSASMSTYGHTGFTGNCVWVDPEHELLYVFVSNRVHPSPNNKKLVNMGIRKRIHQVIYDAMGIKKDTATVAAPQ